MPHNQTYSEWIDSCPNKINCRDTNKLCLQVVYDFLTKVAIDHPSLQYFSKLGQPLTETVTNPAVMLSDFRKLRRIMKGIGLNFNDSPVTFVGYSHTTASITYKGWKRERVTALDQYARFLCGIDSEFALQVDHIRKVYSPHIEAAKRNNEPYEIGLLDDLIIIGGGRSMVVKALTTKKFMQKAGVSEVTKMDGVTSLHFG